MPQISVDLTEAPELKLLDAGEYPVTVTEIKVEQASTGTPMMTVMSTVTGGEYDGSKLFDRLMLSGKGAWRTRQFLEATLGGVEAEQMNFDTDDIIGIEAIAKVTQEVWSEEDGGDGETRNKIKGWKPLTGAEPGEDLFS
jgi:hypothetical protein